MRRNNTTMHVTMVLVGLLVVGPLFASAKKAEEAAEPEPDQKFNIPIKGDIPEEFKNSGNQEFDVHFGQLTVRREGGRVQQQQHRGRARGCVYTMHTYRHHTHTQRRGDTQPHSPLSRGLVLFIFCLFSSTRQTRCLLLFFCSPIGINSAPLFLFGRGERGEEGELMPRSHSPQRRLSLNILDYPYLPGVTHLL